VGIVAITDLVDAVVSSMRLASAVVFVSDLGRALGFPDGLPVLITYPGPERAPRHMISPRVRAS
jgi:hypothetical protein